MICGSELFRPTAPRDPPQEASASSRFFAERISTDCIISATSKILSRFASVPMAVISSPGRWAAHRLGYPRLEWQIAARS
jgi:hypothetical protein